ncbi:hypothetical protein J6590_006657 [Homalodisca vitripennis]|nr:hypothetical protein J6590_006657 [Homalodisca vitripennis]
MVARTGHGAGVWHDGRHAPNICRRRDVPSPPPVFPRASTAASCTLHRSRYAPVLTDLMDPSGDPDLADASALLFVKLINIMDLPFPSPRVPSPRLNIWGI